MLANLAFNNLLREDKAIVTDIAGTTRDVIEEYVNINGVPLKWSILPVSVTDDIVEQIESDPKKLLKDADLCTFVLSKCNEPLTERDHKLLEISQDTNRILLLNTQTWTKRLKLLNSQLILSRFRLFKIKILINWRMNQSIFLWNAGIAEQDATYLNSRHISLTEKQCESLHAVNEGIRFGNAGRLSSSRSNSDVENPRWNH